MTTQSKAMTDDFFDEIVCKQPAEIKPWVLAAVSSRLIDALSVASSAPLEALERDLSRTIRELLRRASPETANALRASIPQGTAAEAYAIGQLSFAHLLVADLSARRVDEHFERALSDKRWAVYLRALMRDEKTNSELAAAAGHAPETVSRHMRELRALGITDFRKEGVHAYNFLMPAARQLLTSKQAVEHDVLHHEYSPAYPEVHALLEKAKNNVPSHMRTAQTFG
jgi:DNA-binding transcriptional ArsR family regulator